MYIPSLPCRRQSTALKLLLWLCWACIRLLVPLYDPRPGNLTEYPASRPTSIYTLHPSSNHFSSSILDILTGFKLFLSPRLVNLTSPKIWAMIASSTCRCRVDGIADSMLTGAFQQKEGRNAVCCQITAVTNTDSESPATAADGGAPRRIAGARRRE